MDRTVCTVVYARGRWFRSESTIWRTVARPSRQTTFMISISRSVNDDSFFLAIRSLLRFTTPTRAGGVRAVRFAHRVFDQRFR